MKTEAKLELKELQQLNNELAVLTAGQSKLFIEIAAKYELDPTKDYMIAEDTLKLKNNGVLINNGESEKTRIPKTKVRK